MDKNFRAALALNEYSATFRSWGEPVYIDTPRAAAQPNPSAVSEAIEILLGDPAALTTAPGEQSL